jgi:hypothetical protein
MKRLLLATTVLILAGCSDDDRAAQLAACKMEAMRLWPNEDASARLRREGDPGLIGVGVVNNHIDQYVPNCMTSHGYTQNVRPDACDTHLRFHMQATCYETSTQYWFEKEWNRFKDALADHRNAR